MTQAAVAQTEELKPEFSFLVFKDGRIRKTTPSFERILGWRAEQVFGNGFSFLLPAEAKTRADLLWEGGRDLKGVVLPRVPLRVANNRGYINFDLQLLDQDGAGTYVVHAFKPSQSGPAGDVGADPLDTDAFFDFVDTMLNGPGDGAAQMTMVDLGGLRDGSIERSHGKETSDALRQQVEAQLKGHAKGGRLGQLDTASYAFLADDGFDQEAMTRELNKTAARLKINEDQLGARSHGLGLDNRNLSSKQLRTALNHARGVFIGEIEGKNEATLSDVIDGVEHHRQLILTALSKNKFRTTQREIRDGRQNVRVGLLDQPRVIIDTRIRQAEDLIVLRDHVDVALKHDLAILDELLRTRAFHNKTDQALFLWFEICVSCLAEDAFFSALSEVLAKHGMASRGIGFRVRHLPSSRRGGDLWQGVERLLAAGHRLWIDRFGDAVVDPSLMEKLKGGMVEVSARTLDQIANHPEGKGLTIRLVDIWTQKGITLLSADLVTHERKVLAHDVGIYIALSDPS